MLDPHSPNRLGGSLLRFGQLPADLPSLTKVAQVFSLCVEEGQAWSTTNKMLPSSTVLQEGLHTGYNACIRIAERQSSSRVTDRTWVIDPTVPVGFQIVVIAATKLLCPHGCAA